MIARSWRGSTRVEDRKRYLGYLNDTGLLDYGRSPGNVGFLVLSRTVGHLAEFTILSFWESSEAIESFAGPDISEAKFYPEDRVWLVEFDEFVVHYEVLAREETIPS